MKPGRMFLAIIALLLLPQPGRAWDAEGHRIVALIADHVLEAKDAAVRGKVRDMLAADKGNDLTKTDIASEATWADALREKSPEARSATSEWHYVRLDFEHPDLVKDCFGRTALPEGYPASHGPRNNCSVDKVEQFAKELRDPDTSPEERLAALRFVLNLIGDMHQPLYAIDRKDMNDNCIALQLPRGKTPVRLSAYWDDILVAEAAGGKDPQKAAAQIIAGLTPDDVAKWSSGTPAEWAQESYAVAKAVAYAFPATPAEGKYTFPARKDEKDSCGPVTVYRADAEYQTRAVATAKTQLAKAGVRLAALLRDSLR